MGVLGFSTPSPFDGIEHYTYPDDNWRVTVQSLGMGRAKYTNRHAHAYFGISAKHGFVDANDFVDHPGDVAIFAQLHLARMDELELPHQRLVLNAKQVQTIIADRMARTNQGENNV